MPPTSECYSIARARAALPGLPLLSPARCHLYTRYHLHSLFLGSPWSRHPLMHARAAPPAAADRAEPTNKDMTVPMPL